MTTWMVWQVFSPAGTVCRHLSVTAVPLAGKPLLCVAEQFISWRFWFVPVCWVLGGPAMKLGGKNPVCSGQHTTGKV